MVTACCASMLLGLAPESSESTRPLSLEECAISACTARETELEMSWPAPVLSTNGSTPTVNCAAETAGEMSVATANRREANRKNVAFETCFLQAIVLRLVMATIDSWRGFHLWARYRIGKKT